MTVNKVSPSYHAFVAINIILAIALRRGVFRLIHFNEKILMASAKYYVSWTRFYEPHCILINVSINPNVSMFRSLKEEEDFVDVTLSCEESQYQAHKVVLSACSPYFRKLLKVITLHICYTFTVLLTLARVQLQNYYLFRFYDLISFRKF